MAYSARIDELEKKFSENARRYFAPLANEYRKAGDLDRAIEICRAHLPQQPGHMSGHVVYGQALYESRQLDEAKTVFEAALVLDPENLIALRHLGDIARDSGDPATARVWYLRVLDADPRNDEVGGMLAELDAAGGPSDAAPPAESAAATSVGWGDINPERSATDSTGGDSAATEPSVESGASTDAERTEEESQAGGEDSAPSAAEADAVESEPRESTDAALFAQDTTSPPAASLDQVLNDAFATSPNSDAVAPDVPAAGRSPRSGESTSQSAELDADTFAEVDALFDEISPPRARTGSQQAVTATPTPDASPDRRGDEAAAGAASANDLFGDAAAAADTQTGDRLAGLETSEFVAPVRKPPATTTRRTTGSMAVTGLTSFDQPTEEDSSTRAAFVTETMAELYLQQGFIAEALDIYRQLLDQNPDDANLRDRVEQLERGEANSLSVASVSSEVIEAARQRHATRPVRTVRSFFGLLAGRRAPHRGDIAEADAGSVANDRPAEDLPYSMTAQAAEVPAPSRLDLVGGLFGDAPVDAADEEAASTLASGFSFAMAGEGDPSLGEQAPVAAPRATQPGRAAHAGGNELSLDQIFREPSSRNPRKSGGYSFDQFFSDGSPGTASPAQPGTTRQDETRESPEGDLEQFTAWLEGLKRK